MTAVAAGRDTLAVLPTGWGKSAIYQLAAVLIPGPTVVVSPLIALQRDQVDGLEEAGIAPAAQANSHVSPADRQQALDDLGSGALEFLFLSPEQLTRPDVLERVAAARPSLFVVDEAHCISAWGHDFRPDYLRLAEAIDAVGRPPVLALTATAAPPVRDEVIERLRLRDPAVIVKGFDRPNIHLSVQRFTSAGAKWAACIEAVLDAGGPGIVYAATRRSTEELADALALAGVRAAAYHGALGRRARDEVHTAFMAGDLDVVVATTAFGMGIDKPNVRFVFHLDVADSLDSYYQEIGRAGRDGEPSRAVLLYRPEDLGLRRFFAGGGDNEARRAYDQSRIDMIRGYAEARGCRRQVLLTYFGEDAPDPCGHCDRCESGWPDEGAGEGTDEQPFPVGSRVAHEAWGEGSVLRYERDTVVVLFDEGGYRTLSVDMVADNDLLRPAS